MSAVSLDVGRGKLGMTSTILVCSDVRCQLLVREEEE